MGHPLQGGQGQGHQRVPLHVAHLGSELDTQIKVPYLTGIQW